MAETFHPLAATAYVSSLMVPKGSVAGLAVTTDFGLIKGEEELQWGGEEQIGGQRKKQNKTGGKGTAERENKSKKNQ